MKYSMVKQFSNAAIDNAYNFVFKSVDFGKLLVEVFWGFVDIWIAFFSIFYNIFMYVYYLFLFVIDRGSESSAPSFRTMGRSQKISKIPTVSLDKSPSVIPAMYRVKEAASGTAKSFSAATTTVTEKTTEAVQKVALAPMKASPAGRGSKKPFFKSVFEFIVEYFITVKEIITKPFLSIADFFAGKMRPVKEEEQQKKPEQGRRVGLIDQYMKEYEKQRRR